MEREHLMLSLEQGSSTVQCIKLQTAKQIKNNELYTFFIELYCIFVLSK